MKFQPRFIAYAKSQKRTPEAQLAHDSKEFPGGCMCGFILWISANVAKFARKHPEAMIGHYIGDQNLFTKFLLLTFNKK